MAWNGGPKNKVGVIEYREKMQRALQLRKAGFSYPAIAEKLGYADHSGAQKIVEKAIKELPKDDAEDVRQLALEQLLDMWRGLMPRMMKGDPNAVKAGLQVMDKRDFYLGLDSPTNDGGQADRAAKLNEMIQAIHEAAGGSDLDASD